MSSRKDLVELAEKLSGFNNAVVRFLAEDAIVKQKLLNLLAKGEGIMEDIVDELNKEEAE